MIAVFAGAVVFLGVASVIKPDPRSATANPAARAGQSGQQLQLPHTQLSQGRPLAGHPRTALQPADAIATRLASLNHPRGYLIIGQLRSKEFRVVAYAGPIEPLYSVFTLDGQLLQSDLAAESVYRDFPDLDLTTLKDLPASQDGAGVFMLADPGQ